jgi:hypothetical protein
MWYFVQVGFVRMPTVSILKMLMMAADFFKRHVRDLGASAAISLGIVNVICAEKNYNENVAKSRKLYRFVSLMRHF